MHTPPSAQDSIFAHGSYLPENNPNLEQILRTANDLNNDASYNVFNSGYQDQDGAAPGEDPMGGKVYQLMSDVGGGSIWGDQFIFDGMVDNPYATAAAAYGGATLSMGIGHVGSAGNNDHYNNFVGFSGGL